MKDEELMLGVMYSAITSKLSKKNTNLTPPKKKRKKKKK